MPPHCARISTCNDAGASQTQEQQQLERLAQQADQSSPACAFCHRPLGSRVEYHHVIPKSEGGETTVPVHPICHRTIHAHVSNHELAAHYADLQTLAQREDMQRFLRWIANKPADFNAPTKRNREKQSV